MTLSIVMDEAKSLLTFCENAKRYDIILCEVLPKKTEHFPIESIIGQTYNIFTDASLRQFGVSYNSENNIRDIRPLCRPLFCHSSVVKHTSSLLQE